MNLDRKIKVLIVDDSGIFRRVLFNQLKDNPDIDIVGMAKDPYEARDIIIKTSPDLLLLDIMMPGLDGIEFLNILKNKRDIPAIAMSGSSNPGRSRRSSRARITAPISSTARRSRV